MKQDDAERRRMLLDDAAHDAMPHVNRGERGITAIERGTRWLEQGWTRQGAEEQRAEERRAEGQRAEEATREEPPSSAASAPQR